MCNGKDGEGCLKSFLPTAYQHLDAPVELGARESLVACNPTKVDWENALHTKWHRPVEGKMAEGTRSNLLLLVFGQ